MMDERSEVVRRRTAEEIVQASGDPVADYAAGVLTLLAQRAEGIATSGYPLAVRVGEALLGTPRRYRASVGPARIPNPEARQ